MSDVKPPALEPLVRDVEQHLRGETTHSPNPTSPLPLPALGLIRPSPHQTEPGNVYAELDNLGAVSARAAHVNPALRAVVIADSSPTDEIRKEAPPSLMLEGSALSPGVVGAIIRTIQNANEVAQPTDNVTKPLSGATPLATGGKMVTSAKRIEAAAALEAPTAETIAETKRIWTTELDEKKLAAKRVDVGAVKTALALLEKLVADLKAFNPPDDAMHMLFQHVGSSRKALLAGDFGKPLTNIENHGHGILSAQEYVVFSKFSPPGVHDQMFAVLGTARKTLMEMNFMPVRVAKVLRRARRHK